MTETLTLKPRKARNPFIAACRMRRAGAHRRTASGERQRAARELCAELKRSP